MRYRDDYAAAGIPMLPVVRGIRGRDPPDLRVLDRRGRGEPVPRPSPRTVGLLYVVAASVLGRAVHRRRMAAAPRPGARARDPLLRLLEHLPRVAVRCHCRRHPHPRRLTPAARRRAALGVGAPGAIAVARRRDRRSAIAVVVVTGSRRRRIEGHGAAPERDARRTSVPTRASSRAARRPTSSCRRSRATARCGCRDFRGQPRRRELLGVVVHPCRKEFPLLAAAHSEVPATTACRSSAMTFRDISVGRPARSPKDQRANVDVRDGGDRDAVAQGLRRARGAADVLHRRRRHDLAAASSAGTVERPLRRRGREDRRARTREAPSTPPSGRSGSRASGAPIAHTSEHDEAPDRERATPGVEHAAHALARARRPGAALATTSSASGACRAGTPCRRGTAARGTAPLAAARFASARSVPGHEHADARERDGADAAGDRARARSRRSASHPSAMPVTMISDGLDDLDREHVRGLRREQPAAATAASTRAASARRSAARSRWRSPRLTIAVDITASASTPGTRKSTGSLKSVVTASTLEKNTRIPMRDHERHEQALAAPQREHAARRGSARRRATRRRGHRVAHALLAGEPQEHLFERAAVRCAARRAERPRSRSQTARSATSSGVRGAATTYSPGRVSRTAPSASPSAAASSPSRGPATAREARSRRRRRRA